MNRLSGKTAIITGAGSGIGEAIARRFAAEGAGVAILDINLDAAEEVAGKILAENGAAATALRCDVSDGNEVARVFAEVDASFGELRILVNNAGITRGGNVENTKPEDFQRVFGVNATGVYNCLRSGVSLLKKNGGGAIVNISSVAAVRPRNMVAYSTSKGGVIALTRAMASSHAQDQVRANCIIPGMVYTPMVAGKLTDEMREQRRKSTPLQTEGTAWDVAHAALFLASDEARWITGAVLPVDGGALLTRRTF